jgi:hypothetical protein
VLVKSLERGGLTQADVDLLDMGQPDAMLALTNGSIDGASLSEPIRTAILAQGGAAVWKEFSAAHCTEKFDAPLAQPVRRHRSCADDFAFRGKDTEAAHSQEDEGRRDDRHQRTDSVLHARQVALGVEEE